jgi:integrase
LSTDRGRILRHIKPLLGRKMIADVNGADVQRFMQDVAAGKTRTNEKTRLRGRAIVRGGRGTAARTVGLLGGIFTFAVRKQLIDANPVRGVERYKDAKRERYLSAGELARLGSALREAENEGESRVAIAAIRLLALTGCRKSEILTLKWDYVDIERSCLRLPDSKTGAKVVPIGAPAVELLASLPRIAGSDYVLPALRGSGYFVDVPSAWVRIRGKADLNDVRLHDLRHSFASVGAAGGDSLLIIGGLLGEVLNLLENRLGCTVA